MTEPDTARDDEDLVRRIAVMIINAYGLEEPAGVRPEAEDLYLARMIVRAVRGDEVTE